MAIEVDDLITPEGDINILDRVGGRINVNISDASGAIDISSWTMTFESGPVTIPLSASGTGQYFIITPAHLEDLIDSKSTRFAVINKTADPDTVVWEGFILIRSVD